MGSEEKVRKPSYDYLQIMTRSQHEVEDVESDEKSVNTDGAVENYDSEQISVFANRDDKLNSQSLTTGHVFDKI